METAKPFLWMLAIAAAVTWFMTHETDYDRCMDAEMSAVEAHIETAQEADTMCYREATERAY